MTIATAESPVTIYRITSGSRWTYSIYALVFGSGSFALGFALVSGGVTQRSFDWIEYIFFVPIALLTFRFAAYCGLRAIGSSERLYVYDWGIAYRGALRLHRWLWTDIASVKPIRDRGTFDWLEIKIYGKWYASRIRVDLTESAPDKYELMNQIRRLSPHIRVWP